jgi:hypothetical protein
MGTFPDTGPAPGALGWDGPQRSGMPIYVDYHPSTELSLSQIRTFLQAARQATPDQHGAQPVDLFCGDDGHVFCVHAASSEAAVLRRHRSLGLPCRALHEVTRLPAGQDRKASLQQVVARLEAALDNEVDQPSTDWLQQVV